MRWRNPAIPVQTAAPRYNNDLLVINSDLQDVLHINKSVTKVRHCRTVLENPISIDEQQQESSRRIYLVTEGLKPSHTKRAYRQAFDHFIKTTVKSDDLRALLDTKQNVIESKIIDYITYLKDIQHLSYLSIQVNLSGILHFFEINDYYLKTKKIIRSYQKMNLKIFQMIGLTLQMR